MARSRRSRPIPPDTPPDLSEPGIYIDKECFPGIFGGEIHCEITVTNVGETLSDPIDLYDAATILSGPARAAAVIVTGVTPDGPDWICSPTPTPDLWCSLPPDALDPGETRSIEVFLDTGPLFAAGNFGFLNCAELEAPWHDVACDEGGTDITVTKTAPAACVPGADCTFTVTITNTGAFPFSGPVQFTDGMFLRLAVPGPFGPPITAIVPALGCAPPPAAIGFSCEAPLTLAPGESEAFAITVTDAAGGPFPAYWVQNCFAVSAPGAAAAGPAARPRRRAARPSAAPGCRSARLRRLSNLRVDKRALNSGDCYKVGPALIALRLRDRDLQRRSLTVLWSHDLHDDIPASGNAGRRLPGGLGLRRWTASRPAARPLRRYSRRRLDRRADHRDDPAGAARGGRLRHAEHRDDHRAGRHG